MYDVDALKTGIKKCKQNIKTFEKAIDKERKTIDEYYGYIELIQKKREIPKEIIIKAEKDGN